MMSMHVWPLVEDLSRLAASSFVSGIWQGAVLAAVVWVCLRLVPRTSAAVRFAVWTAVFGVLAVLPLVHAYGSGAAAGVADGHAAVRLDVRWSFAIAAVWAVMSVVRAAELAGGAVRLRGIWKRATPVRVGEKTLRIASEPHATGELHAAGGLMHFDGASLVVSGKQMAEICTSADVDRPSVIGFLSPRILIPEELYGRLTAAELEQIVLHEAGHLRRGDDWMNLLQKISLVAVPLNPVLMWIERRMCLERELACDDSVLQLTRAPKAYATCLTNLAEHRLDRRAAGLSLGAWEKRSELGRRVHSILRGGERMGRAQAGVVVGVAVFGLLGGAAELARCPQFVSFTGGVAPAAVAARSLPVGEYQPVVFRPERGVMGGAHETLLKASMPVRAERPVSVVVPKDGPSRSAATRVVRSGNKQGRNTGILRCAQDDDTKFKFPGHSAASLIPGHSAASLIRSRQAQIGVSQEQRLVVLTSWSAPERGAVLFTVTRGAVSEDPSRDRGPSFSSSFAAVPTPGGWLVIQL